MLGQSVRLLHSLAPALATQENFNALIESGGNAGAIIDGLRALQGADLLSQKNFDLLFDSDSGTIEPLLLTKENFDRLFPKHHQDSKGRLILYPASDHIPEMEHPPRVLPIPLTQESFEEFIGKMMSAKYHPLRISPKQLQYGLRRIKARAKRKVSGD